MYGKLDKKGVQMYVKGNKEVLRVVKGCFNPKHPSALNTHQPQTPFTSLLIEIPLCTGAGTGARIPQPRAVSARMNIVVGVSIDPASPFPCCCSCRTSSSASQKARLPADAFEVAVPRGLNGGLGSCSHLRLNVCVCVRACNFACACVCVCLCM